MKRTFSEAINKRRSIYALSPQSPISDERIEEILADVINTVPSAFNSQSARVLLLLNDEHKKLWNIVLETLRKIVPPADFAATESKITNCFAAGYGTVLFFEATEVTEGFEERFPPYAANFPIWAQQSIGILQFAVWTALADAGLGASLQHYNPLIDDEVKANWDVPSTWTLLAQMPFGVALEEAGPRQRLAIEERLFVKK